MKFDHICKLAVHSLVKVSLLLLFFFYFFFLFFFTLGDDNNKLFKHSEWTSTFYSISSENHFENAF